MNEKFISPRAIEEQRLEFNRGIFEAIMTQVDEGLLARDEAFELLDKAADEPEFASQLLVDATSS